MMLYHDLETDEHLTIEQMQQMFNDNRDIMGYDPDYSFKEFLSDVLHHGNVEKLQVGTRP